MRSSWQKRTKPPKYKTYVLQSFTIANVDLQILIAAGRILVTTKETITKEKSLECIELRCEKVENGEYL